MYFQIKFAAKFSTANLALEFLLLAVEMFKIERLENVRKFRIGT